MLHCFIFTTIFDCKSKLNEVIPFLIHMLILNNSLCRIVKIIDQLPVWHRYPLYPGKQVQLMLLTRSLQLPPFKQGEEKQSSLSGKAWHSQENYTFTHTYTKQVIFELKF